MSKFDKDQLSVIVGTYEASAGEEYEVRSAVMADLAAEFNVSVPSIRGILVSAKVYKAKPKSIAAGGRGATKAELAKGVGACVGKELPSLTNMTAKDLQALMDWIVLSSARVDAEK